jgi:hypothetical protein
MRLLKRSLQIQNGLWRGSYNCGCLSAEYSSQQVFGVFMKIIATIGNLHIESNSSGEMFITSGHTKLRVSDIGNGVIRVTFAGKGGEFVPGSIAGVPAMEFHGKTY